MKQTINRKFKNLKKPRNQRRFLKIIKTCLNQKRSLLVISNIIFKSIQKSKANFVLFILDDEKLVEIDFTTENPNEKYTDAVYFEVIFNFVVLKFLTQSHSFIFLFFSHLI